MALMKCGWLWRKSSVLRRWKRSWFDLWMDGNLVFYQDETRRDYEDRIRLKYKCANVKAGSECTGVEPPDGISSHCLVIIYMKNGSTLILCADSEDEALAWKLTMLEVKVNPVHVYNPYDDNYHTVPLDGHNAVYISPGYPGYSYGGISRSLSSIYCTNPQSIPPASGTRVHSTSTFPSEMQPSNLDTHTRFTFMSRSFTLS
ncbi:si:ch211-176g13.7 isoform X1 [Polyodon spathula]|uniref:si:ch211-176g13.7 isoform X1 n=1 Tax=Polyodon spathula TaxID=7913 RepID=UPI001B7F5808|nr:si:ch211-176g13.7 isoform X1 [Polyodon spathula]